MRLLQLHHLTQLNVYDVARFGCSEFWAAEALPTSAAFAGGQGAGLWSRRFGSRDLPVAVAGSEAMRIYQLGVLTFDDGAQQLVGLGVRTADLFAGDLPLPQRWALKVPNPLMIFYSSDGVTWNEYSLGEIEKADGDYPLSEYHTYAETTPKEEDWLYNRPASVQNALMNSTGQWREGINEWGAPCLWACSGTHLIEWDGYDARVTPLGTRATALALSNGRFYFSAGSRTSLSGVDGVLAFTNIGITSLKAPQFGEARIVMVGAGENLIALKEKPDAVPHTLQAVAYVGGQWLILLAREWANRSHQGETTKQELASFYLPSLPTEPIEIATRGLEYLELSSAQEYFDLGRYYNPLGEPGKPPDPLAIRRCSGRAYIFQRKDFQDEAGDLTVADMDRETMPVLEMLCNPSLADFDLTAALPHGEGHILGTADGYLLSARIAQNRVNALARLDGAVLKLVKNGGAFSALTAGALWKSDGGAQWEAVRAAFQDMTWRDAAATTDGRLFAVESNGTDSRVSVLGAGGVSLLDEAHNARVLSVLCEHSSGVYVFGYGSGYLIYDGSNDATAATAALLAGETVTAAASLGALLVVGTASGKLLTFDGTTWQYVATTTWPIAGFAVIGDCLWIRYGDGVGFYSSWSSGESAVTNHAWNAPCATSVRFFLDGSDGSDGSGCDRCSLLLLTDAGPVWQSCAPDAIWFSQPRHAAAGESFDEVLALPLADSGSPLVAQAYVGDADAGDDLTQYQPLEPAVNVRLLRPLASLRFAVSHAEAQLHRQYEFVTYQRRWKE